MGLKCDTESCYFMQLEISYPIHNHMISMRNENKRHTYKSMRSTTKTKSCFEIDETTHTQSEVAHARE